MDGENVSREHFRRPFAFGLEIHPSRYQRSSKPIEGFGILPRRPHLWLRSSRDELEQHPSRRVENVRSSPHSAIRLSTTRERGSMRIMPPAGKSFASPLASIFRSSVEISRCQLFPHLS